MFAMAYHFLQAKFKEPAGQQPQTKQFIIFFFQSARVAFKIGR